MLLPKDGNYFTSLLAKLVRIPSRSSATGGEEGALQRVVAEEMAGTGARVRTLDVDDAPGFREHALCHGPDRNYADRPTVIAEMGPEDAPALLVAAHSDTVQLDCMKRPEDWTVDPFAAEIHENCMYGLGVGDDKWGLAAMLTLMRSVAAAGATLDRRLVFASTIDEEHGVGNGMLLLMLAGIKAEACLYLDGGEGQIGIGLLGGSNLLLRPRGAVSEERLAQDLASLTAAAAEMSASRVPLFERPYFTGNAVRSRSVRADRQTDNLGELLRVPFFTFPDEEPAAFKRALEEKVRQVLGGHLADYDLSYREPWFEPTLGDPRSPHVAALAASWESVTGRPPVYMTLPKQDAFVLVNHAGIPTVSFGASRFVGRGAYHQPDENIDLEFAWRCCNVAHETVCKWLTGAF